jgi:hypothetical protein
MLAARRSDERGHIDIAAVEIPELEVPHDAADILDVSIGRAAVDETATKFLERSDVRREQLLKRSAADVVGRASALSHSGSHWFKSSIAHLGT